MSGQIVDATLVPLPSNAIPMARRRRSRKASLPKRFGQISRIRPRKRIPMLGWTLKIGGKVRYRPDGTPLPQIALPVFGYKSHISIDRKFGFIRGSMVTSAADADGRQLRYVLCKDNTASDVWADSAYRSQSNEKWLASKHADKPSPSTQASRQTMPMATSRANAKKSSIRARVEHVFAHQKNLLRPVHTHDRDCSGLKRN